MKETEQPYFLVLNDILLSHAKKDLKQEIAEAYKKYHIKCLEINRTVQRVFINTRPNIPVRHLPKALIIDL